MPVLPLTLDAIRQPAILYDAGGRVVAANDLAEALAGRPLTDCSTADVVAIFDIRRPDGTPLEPPALPAARVLAGEEAIDVPLVVTASDGRPVHILISASPLREGVEVVGALAIWQDVSALVAARASAERAVMELEVEQEELRQATTALERESAELDRQRRLLDAILASLPHQVSLWDREQRLVWANERFSAERGLGRDEMIGRSWWDLGYDANMVGPFDEETRRSASAGRPLGREIGISGPGGTAWMTVTAVPIFGDSVLVISEDATDRHRAEEALGESERRHAFLLGLDDRIREIPEIQGIVADSTRLIGRHLGVNGVAYCEVDATGEYATVLSDWTDGTVPGAAGRHQLDDRGVGDLYRRGLVRRTGTVPPGHAGDETAAHGELGIRASLGVPICRGDRLAAILTVQSATPRSWTDPEVELLRDAGDRLWASVDRARAREALRLSAERLRLAQEGAGIGIWDRDAANDRVTISPGFLEAYGLDATTISGYKDLVPWIHPDDREVVEAGRQAAFAADGPLNLEFRVVAPSGEARWVQFKGHGVTDGEGTLVRVIGVLIDMTDRRRAEEALREREQTLQGVFRAAPVGIGMVSHRRITMVNDRLCSMTGYSRDELIGQDARLLYPDEEAYAYVGREKYAQIAETGTGAVETQWQTKHGTIRDILLSSSPIDLAHPLDDVVFNALDITQLRTSERALASYMDELQRSNEELQLFAYVASHDLQEPLRSIVSFSQLLERRYKGKLDADADEFIAFIIEGGNRMQRLIMDLLQLSRVETKARPLAPTDAGEVVAEALRLMETPIREAGGTVVVEDLPTVMADADQLTQVFTNLVGNALKYRRPDVPPEVRISAERTGAFWRFSVADNGIGIEAEYFDRIFVIFQRLHTRDEYEGTGIGLAVVRKIVERHGGRIGLESTPGQGSTFSFTIPVP
jgi:PAS domain S-box-containing protein